MDAKEEGLRETIQPGGTDQPGDRVGTKSKENAREEHGDRNVRDQRQQIEFALTDRRQVLIDRNRTEQRLTVPARVECAVLVE